MAYNNIDDAFLGRMADLQFPPMPVEEPGQESITLAAGPTGTMSDAGRGMPSIKPLPQTTLERALEQTGLTLEQAGRFLDSLGQVDIPLLGKVSLADLVPFVGSPKEGSRSVMAPAEWQGTPQMLQQMGTGVGSMVDRVTTGTGMARQLRPDAKLAAMDVATNIVPVAKVAAKGAKAAGKALAPKAGEMLSDYMRRSGMQLDLMAYHGTPHRFDKFDSSKIGTGEGAQAYGYGLYFAENKGVAQGYQTMLGSRDQDVVNNAISRVINLNNQPRDALILEGFPQEKITPEIAQTISNIAQNTNPDGTVTSAAIKEYNKLKSLVPNQGLLYTVDVPDSTVAKMLDFDAPLGQQSPEIQALAQKYNLSMDDLGGDLLAAAGGKTAKGAQIMREAGIPGVRYLDQGSRNNAPKVRRVSVDGQTKYEVNPGWKAPNQLKFFDTNEQAQEYADSFVSRNIVVFPGGEDQIKIIKTEGAK